MEPHMQHTMHRTKIWAHVNWLYSRNFNQCHPHLPTTLSFSKRHVQSQHLTCSAVAYPSSVNNRGGCSLMKLASLQKPLTPKKWNRCSAALSGHCWSHHHVWHWNWKKKRHGMQGELSFHDSVALACSSTRRPGLNTGTLCCTEKGPMPGSCDKVGIMAL